MKFVGIRNCRAKHEMLRADDCKIREFPTADLTYDCIRHLDFLRRLAEGMEQGEYPGTLYWKYIRMVGGGREKALRKSRELADLFRFVRDEELEPADSYAAVTDDGVRLDGSHRTSVALVLGIESLPVRVYHWGERFPEKKLDPIREETRIKRDAQEAYLGKAVVGREDGELVGTVAFVDARPVPQPWWRFLAPIRLRPFVIVEQRGGTLAELPVDDVDFR